MYNLKMKSKDFFKINDKLVVKNLTINDDLVNFDVDYKNLLLIKKTKYEYEILNSNTLKSINLIKKYYYVIIGILFLISLIYLNSFKVDDIKFSNKTVVNEQIKKDINSNLKTLFFFKYSNINYIEFSKKIRIKYFNYPYINITQKNNTIYVDIYDTLEDVLIKDQHESEIIAKCDALVDLYYIYSGTSLVSKNKFVKKGDVLVKPDTLNSCLESRALILGYTYYKRKITIPKKIQEYNYDNLDSYLSINLFNLNFDLLKNETNNEIIKTNTVFNLFDFFNVKKIETSTKFAIIKTYEEDDALKACYNELEKEFLLRQTHHLEKIDSINLLSKSEDKDNYTFEFIIKSYESLGEVKLL